MVVYKNEQGMVGRSQCAGRRVPTHPDPVQSHKTKPATKIIITIVEVRFTVAAGGVEMPSTSTYTQVVWWGGQAGVFFLFSSCLLKRV